MLGLVLLVVALVGVAVVRGRSVVRWCGSWSLRSGLQPLLGVAARAPGKVCLDVKRVETGGQGGSGGSGGVREVRG